MCLKKLSAHPSEVFVVAGILQMQFVLVLLREACQHAVEHVVVPLLRVLVHDAGLLQQVLVHFGSLDRSILVEENVDVFPEPRRVVVPHGFCVAKG